MLQHPKQKQYSCQQSSDQGIQSCSLEICFIYPSCRHFTLNIKVFFFFCFTRCFEIGISSFSVLLALALGYLAFINNFHFDLSWVCYLLAVFCTFAEMTTQNWIIFFLAPFQILSLKLFLH